MTQSDDKPRGASVREASHLRATLGSEPSSGYAFHDQVRVDRVERTRTPRNETASPQTASHAPRERSFARTLAGGVTIQEALAGRALHIDPPTANDQAGPQLSWPPMPQVPQELLGSVEEALETKPSAREESAIIISAKKASSAPPVAGGAIWQAMPSVVEAMPAVSNFGAFADPHASTFGALADPHASPPSIDALPTPQLSTSAATIAAAQHVASEPPRNSRPAAYRPSVGELEAEHRDSYADKRLLKYEGLVERNAWEQLTEELSKERGLSPALRLLSIVARRETLKGDQKQAAARLTQEAISAVAQLLQVPEASPTALVIGKRLLRKNPGWTQKREASTGLSIGIMLGGIAAGAGFGWLVTALLL